MAIVNIASAYAGSLDSHSNCFYICRYCNVSRGATPVTGAGGTRYLLNPCKDVWAEAFSLQHDQLKPRAGSPEAQSTLEIYDLNEPRKVRRRRSRRKQIRERLDFIDQARIQRDALLETATRTLDFELVDVARLLEEQLRNAWKDLEHFQVVPQDARRPCVCARRDLCELPTVLEEQILNLDAFSAGEKHPQT